MIDHVVSARDVTPETGNHACAEHADGGILTLLMAVDEESI